MKKTDATQQARPREMRVATGITLPLSLTFWVRDYAVRHEMPFSHVVTEALAAYKASKEAAA